MLTITRASGNSKRSCFTRPRKSKPQENVRLMYGRLLRSEKRERQPGIVSVNCLRFTFAVHGSLPVYRSAAACCLLTVRSNTETSDYLVQQKEAKSWQKKKIKIT